MIVRIIKINMASKTICRQWNSSDSCEDGFEDENGCSTNKFHAMVAKMVVSMQTCSNTESSHKNSESNVNDDGSNVQ